MGEELSMSTVFKLASIARGMLIKLLNKSFPYLYLELKLPMALHIYFPPDAFAALEENLISRNIYFDPYSIRDADTIIDLGAHAGSFTIYAILYSKPETRIIAVEPSRRNYELLLNNLKLFENIIRDKKLEILVLRKAVWSQRGRFKFVDTGYSEGGHIDEAQYTREGTFIETITLDELIALSKGRVLVKMDIEGAELPVLTASKELHKVIKLAMEAHGREVYLVKALRLRGYECKIITYKLNPQLLFKEWLKVTPRIYGFIVAIYRFLALASSIIHPTITIVKAEKADKSQYPDKARITEAKTE
jgi:FkbM family methyltransferase